MRKKKATFHVIMLLTATLLIASIASAQSEAEQVTKKKRGTDNMTMGIAKSNDKETGNFGLLKSVSWKLRSDWISAGINFGIVKNEIMIMGSITLNIPLKRIEPFLTAGYGIIFETFSLVNNYGAGIRIWVGKSVGIITEYRKFHFKQQEKQKGLESKIVVDYFGAGIFYTF